MVLLLVLSSWMFLALPAYAELASASPGALAEDPSTRPSLHHSPRLSEDRTPSLRFDGGHLGLLLSLAALRPAVSSSGLGWRGRLALRYATLLQLLDVEVGLAHSSGLLKGGGVRRESMGLQVSGHPLFVALVWDNFVGWVLAGAHVFASLGVDRVALSGVEPVAAAGGTGETLGAWSLSPALGVGLDLPLGGRAGRGGLWLTLRWSRRWLGVGPNPGESLDLDEQGLSLGLGWRSYGLGHGAQD